MAERVLLAQTSFLGDVVLTTAFARALQSADAEVELWWLVRPQAVPLLEPTYGSERVLAFDKYGVDAGPVGLARMAGRLRSIGFAKAYGIQRSLRTASLLALAGIPLRVGYAGSAGAWLYHRRVPRRGSHALDRLLALLEGDRGTASGLPEFLPHLDVDPVADRRVERRLAEAGAGREEEPIVVAPGSAWATKEWPAESFAEAAARLARPGLDRIVVLGTTADTAKAHLMRKVIEREADVAMIDATGGTSIADAIAWLARARLVLANDSAPAHIAASFGRPLVSVFGPTVPAQGFAPLGPLVRIVGKPLECRPCSRHGGARCPIDTHECMVGLGVSEVVAAGRDLLAPKRGRDAEAG